MSFIDQQIEVFRQFTFIGSLLAGFSFAVIFQLLTLNDQRRRTAWTLGTLLVASSSLIAATFVSSLVVAYYKASAEPYYLDTVGSYAQVGKNLLYLGILSFLAGVGMSGWLRSRPIGFVSTILAVGCAGVMFKTWWQLTS